MRDALKLGVVLACTVGAEVQAQDVDKSSSIFEGIAAVSTQVAEEYKDVLADMCKAPLNANSNVVFYQQGLVGADVANVFEYFKNSPYSVKVNGQDDFSTTCIDGPSLLDSCSKAICLDGSESEPMYAEVSFERSDNPNQVGVIVFHAEAGENLERQGGAYTGLRYEEGVSNIGLFRESTQDLSFSGAPQYTGGNTSGSFEFAVTVADGAGGFSPSTHTIDVIPYDLERRKPKEFSLKESAEDIFEVLLDNLFLTGCFAVVAIIAGMRLKKRYSDKDPSVLFEKGLKELIQEKEQGGQLKSSAHRGA